MKTLPIISMLILLASCWKQHDELTIYKDGRIKFETAVEITDKSFSYRDIDQLSSDLVQSLIKKGWSVEKEWTSKEKPYKLEFIGQGNIKTVAIKSDFYQIYKISDNEYKIRFIPAKAKNGVSSRSIELTWTSEPLYKDGQAIDEIENVLGNDHYLVKVQ